MNKICPRCGAVERGTLCGPKAWDAVKDRPQFICMDNWHNHKPEEPA